MIGIEVGVLNRLKIPSDDLSGCWILTRVKNENRVSFSHETWINWSVIRFQVHQMHLPIRIRNQSPAMLQTFIVWQR